MRFFPRLCAQHLDWTFKKHWQIQGKRVPCDSNTTEELQKLGINVKNPLDILTNRNVKMERYISDQVKPVQYLMDETHPLWHKRECYIYNENNVLLEGMPQAQLLTKSIEISGLPKHIEDRMNNLNLSSSIAKNIQNSIMISSVFDAEQVKLPKMHLQERPGFNLPRLYGISKTRTKRLLINKLINECEKLCGPSITSNKKYADNTKVRVNIEKENELLQFNINIEKLITSTKPLNAIKGVYNGELNELHPLKSTISIPKTHIYLDENISPLSTPPMDLHPHTIISYFDNELVKNLHGTEVTNSQFQSRSLINSFSVAASQAIALYGDSSLVKLPKPIVIQSIQTDGRIFHFGIFQLNTLSISGLEGVRNYWFHVPNLELFKECGYKEGKPNLLAYNTDIFRLFYIFYQNI